MMTGGMYAVLGTLVTLSIFVAQIIFKTGHLTARVEELEKWRTSIRNDMHEVSEELQGLRNDIGQLKTLIEERTERRGSQRT